MFLMRILRVAEKIPLGAREESFLKDKTEVLHLSEERRSR
jgi:hypothetical protein